MGLIIYNTIHGICTVALKQMLKQAAHTCKCKTPTFLLEVIEMQVDYDYCSLLYTDETLVPIIGVDLKLETFFCFKQCQLFIYVFILAKTLSDIINISHGR